MSAVRALLTGVVDYAGLFPPAALDMPTAVRNYVAYRTDPSSWMLGRFVVPVARLDELVSTLAKVDRDGQPVALTVVCGGDAVADIAAAIAFKNTHADRLTLDAAEARVDTVDAIERAGASAGHHLELFAELPSDPDPRELVAAAARAGVSAKIRTGGLTPEAFPPAKNVVRFIRRCLDANVRFKATAGLHHPIRAEYALTYDATPPRGTMYGYLNLLLATAFMREGMSDGDAQRVLEEEDPTAFEITSGTIGWRGRSLATETLQALRDDAAVSFGSCSFREPVDELHALSPLA